MNDRAKFNIFHGKVIIIIQALRFNYYLFKFKSLRLKLLFHLNLRILSNLITIYLN